MSLFLKIFLPIYFVLFFGLAMLWRSIFVWKATGLNPYKLSSTDSAHDYIGVWFRLVMLAAAVMVALYAFAPNAYPFLMPIPWLAVDVLIWIGVILLTAALVWTLIAQADMGKSWRIGVDKDVATELVSRGLFKLTRNPIFLGMRVMLLGVFLTLPNLLSFTTLILGEVLMQIQVRLEEEHLLKLHGVAYQQYQKQTRRWI
jgi:protein-S-isoprenylcysteine O-methyltransferase Ste14